ncbi:hypothetical protein Tco_0420493 [Tanacetum coccineum]
MATPMAEDTTSFEDDRFAFISTKDIQHTSCLLDNKISILKVELQRMNLELDSFKEKIKLNKQFPYFVGNIILMVDSITFGQDMVNILVSGEEYDKVFNHLDMLNAPLEDFTTTKNMSSNTSDYIYPTIVPSDVDVEDAFSSTTTPNYTPASPDYSPTSPGNTSFNPSDDLSKYLLASLAISPFHDDPYMKVMQAYNNATSDESPIPPP